MINFKHVCKTILCASHPLTNKSYCTDLIDIYFFKVILIFEGTFSKPFLLFNLISI